MPLGLVKEEKLYALVVFRLDKYKYLSFDGEGLVDLSRVSKE